MLFINWILFALNLGSFQYIVQINYLAMEVLKFNRNGPQWRDTRNISCNLISIPPKPILFQIKSMHVRAYFDFTAYFHVQVIIVHWFSSYTYLLLCIYQKNKKSKFHFIIVVTKREFFSAQCTLTSIFHSISFSSDYLFILVHKGCIIISNGE